MLLITEHTEDINLITEEVDGERQYHIDGIFMQAEQKNRNGRVYPKKTLMNEVARYN
ncbi:MAG: primosomal protein, partial [Hyphomonas sp.]|nr:primosomal protein [Hyphomonas sp.]